MKKSLFYGIMACACLAAACNDDGTDAPGAPQEAPLVLAGEAWSFDPEAGATIWSVGRNVGVFLVDSDTKEVIDPYLNVKYVSTKRPEGYFSPEEPDQVVRLTAQRTDAVLYYPYQEDATTIRPMNIASQPASLADFRYGRGEGVTCSDNRRKLSLRPVFSQLVFEVVAGEGVTDAYLQDASIAVEGCCTQADFNLAAGTFENGRDMQPIALAPAASGAGASGLLFPQATVGDAVRAVIALPRMNRTEEWPFNERIPALEPGMRYTCTVRVSQQRIDVTTRTEPIEEWTDGSETAGSGCRNEIPCLIEELPAGPLEWIHNNNSLSQTAAGDWRRVTNGNATDGKIRAAVEPDAESGRRVIRAEFPTASWYMSYLCCRMGQARPCVSKIAFRAKGTAGRQIRCYLKNNYGGNSVFVSSPATEGAAHAGILGFTLGSEWQTYELAFDLRKISTNGVNTPSAAHIIDATEQALADFFIAFYAVTANTEFYLDDLSFAPEN